MKPVGRRAYREKLSDLIQCVRQQMVNCKRLSKINLVPLCNGASRERVIHCKARAVTR